MQENTSNYAAFQVFLMAVALTHSIFLPRFPDLKDSLSDNLKSSGSTIGDNEDTPLLSGAQDQGNIQDKEKSVEVKLKDFQLIRVPQGAVSHHMNIEQLHVPML